MNHSQKISILLKAAFFVLLTFVISCNLQEEQAEPTKSISLEAISYPKDSQSMQIFEGAEPTKQYFPIKNGNRKWKIGYLEGGPYIEYRNYLTAVIEGLMEIGWVEKEPIPEFEEDNNGESSTKLWNWLATKSKSKYVTFVENGHYSSDWDDAIRVKTQNRMIRRLKNTKDIDLVIAAGTWAGKDLANNKHKIPAIVVSTSAPVEAGIIESPEDSGFNHILAQVDPLKWQQQLNLFHNVVRFKKLGVAYENTQNGKSYAALDSVLKVAKAKGFQVKRCTAPSDIPDVELAYRKLLQCHKRLAREVDAMFITDHGGFSGKAGIKPLLAPFVKAKIPTLSQLGYDHVRQGVLLGIGSTDYKSFGIYYAQVIQRIFNGEKPRDISQIFVSPVVIAINLAVAKELGFKLTAGILGAADAIFTEVE